VDVVRAQCLCDHRRGRGTALAYKGEPRRRLTGAADLPDYDLERPGRPWVPIADVGAIEAKDDVVTGGYRLTGGCGTGAQQSFPDAYRAVADGTGVGRPRERQDLTEERGHLAKRHQRASFAVRYSNSGAMPTRRVNSAGTVAGASGRHRHA
jgi:hypothetical protein